LTSERSEEVVQKQFNKVNVLVCVVFIVSKSIGKRKRTHRNLLWFTSYGL